MKVKPRARWPSGASARRRPSEVVADSIEYLRADTEHLADVLSTGPADGTIQAPSLDAFIP